MKYNVDIEGNFPFVLVNIMKESGLLIGKPVHVERHPVHCLSKLCLSCETVQVIFLSISDPLSAAAVAAAVRLEGHESESATVILLHSLCTASLGTLVMHASVPGYVLTHKGSEKGWEG